MAWWSRSERSDAGTFMVLELTGIGQLESGWGFIFLSFLLIQTAVGAVEMWKSGALGLGRISKPGGKSGKLVLAFGVFHAFHAASFPRRFSSRSSRSEATRFVPPLEFPSVLGQNPNFLTKISRQDRLGTAISWLLDRRHLAFLAQASLPPRFLRIDSPRISMRWALCTSRSRMLSAKVGSPICSCHWATGSWLVSTVERAW